MWRLSSGFRERSPDATLIEARALAARIGITRVTEITSLDRVGVPVFASIRPMAAEGHICVNAGKGLTKTEAEIGALMEAIECAFAEPGASALDFSVVTAGALERTLPGRSSLADLCPLFQTTLDASTLMPAVEARILDEISTVLLPAELIFMPTRDLPCNSIFGGSTNGICSGNSLREALLHGVCEVLERDVTSINCVYNTSQLVPLDSLPSEMKNLLRGIEDAGLSLIVRYTESVLGFPYFEAYLLESDDSSPIAIAAGFGLHPARDIAIVRAITEAAQARLSHIHGGRDDIIRRHQMFHRNGPKEGRENSKFRKRLARADRVASYVDTADYSETCLTLEDAWQCVNLKLRRAELGPVCFVPFTSDNAPLQVARVVVPGLEHFEPELHRVGPRMLRAFANAI